MQQADLNLLSPSSGKKTKEGGFVLSPEASAKPSDTPSSPEVGSREDAVLAKPTDVPRVLLPLKRKTEEPVAAQEAWSRLGVQKPCGLVAIFKFQRLLPPGLFERACVRLHRFETFHLKFLAHWKVSAAEKLEDSKAHFSISTVTHYQCKYERI